MTVFGPEIEVAVARIRDDVSRLHGELVRYGLVVWTGGNVSARVPGADLFVIKPSGVSYSELGPENLVLCTLDGSIVPGTPGSERKPSLDTATHAYLYRSMPEVGGIAHTHSPYATAWAARSEPIPCVITSMAEEFGGDVPVAAYPSEGEAEHRAAAIGRELADALTSTGGRAVLLESHGPFTVGRNAEDAVKSAVMLEDAARTIHLSRQLGTPVDLAPDTVGALFDRYQSVYGQPGEITRMNTAQSGTQDFSHGRATAVATQGLLPAQGEEERASDPRDRV